MSMSHQRPSIISRSLPSLTNHYVTLIESYARKRSLNKAKILHAHIITNGLAHLSQITSKLISLYVACGKLHDARNLFDKIPQKNIRRWVALVSAYARYGHYNEAIKLFNEMQREGLKVNIFVVPSVLKACGNVSDPRIGGKIHAVVLKRSFGHDVFVNSALIDMYSKCGEVDKGRRVFDEMVEKDLVALNAMVSGYAQCGLMEEAFELVERMKGVGIKLNVVTWNALITGFSQKGDEVMVSEILELMVANGVEPDVVTWTSVISGLVQNFRYKEAFDMFKRMFDHGFYPSSATISSLLPACGAVANARRGREIHGYALVIGVEDDIYVRSALVDMYAKCGFIFEARALFYKMSERNTVTWNSMIFGYANHGYCMEAIELFNEMITEKETELDHLTFTAVLAACSHAGLTELGQSLFDLMQDKYGIVPKLEHYACLVDILARAGKLTEAYDVIKRMPIKPDLFVWGALLGGCKNYGHVELAEIAAKEVSKLDNDAGSYKLLSSLYADTGGWMNVAKLKKKIKKRKMKKISGSSWIEAA